MGITQAYSVLCFYDVKNMVCGRYQIMTAMLFEL